MPNVNLTPYASQQADIDRRRKMAQALVQQSMEPLPMPETPGVKISPISGLAQLLSGVFGGLQERKLNKQQSTLDTDKSAAVRQQMAALLGGQGGSHAEQAPGLTSTPATITMPPDPWANSAGLSSEFPQVSEMARALVANRMKRADTEQAQGFDAGQADLQRQFLGEQTNKQLAQALTLANRPKPAGSYAPGGVYGTEDPTTGKFTQEGSVPNRPLATPQPQPPMTPERFQQEQQLKVPPRPVAVQTVDDKGNPVTRFVSPQVGQELPAAPTADMRNKQQGRELVGRSIKAIEDMSNGIITKVGPSQRADAIKRGAEAVFGNDPNFRTYQDARMALAGNLAVGQQGSRPSDADIKAIWLPLVPDPYRDTSESAKMKWDLIRLMSNAGAVGGQPGAVPTVGGTFNGAKVLKVTPVP